MSKLITFILTVQTDVKILHWNTKKHSIHMATDRFLDSFKKHSDLLVESYLGFKKQKINIKNIKLTIIKDSNAINYMSKKRNELLKISNTLFKTNNTSNLKNIIDEILTDFDLNIYLLNQN